MQGIVCIAGTNRPDNYTARALGIVVDALRQSRIDPLVFDARSLSLAFPGHPDPGDGERLRTAITAAPGVILATPEYHGSFCAMTKLIIENLGFPSVLAGKPVAVAHTPAFGCSTKWKSKIDSQLKEMQKIEAEPVKVEMATADDLKKLRTNPTGKVDIPSSLSDVARAALSLPARLDMASLRERWTLPS